MKYLLKKDLQVTLSTSVFNVKEELKTDFYKATYKGTDVTSSITIEGNYDVYTVGKYTLTFVYEKDGKKHKTTKKIEIKDLQKPEITLTRGNIKIPINSIFSEPGYQAIDNYDGDITSRVKIQGEIDTKKEGTYTLTYEVEDKSGNKTSINRIVTVTKDSPLSMSVKDFTLEGYFQDTILSKTEDKGNKYIDSIIFAGDSMPLYYVMNGMISGKQLWHREAIDPEKALVNTIYINHQESGKTFVEAFQTYQPEIVIMTLGTNSAAFMEPSYFIETYTELLKALKKASPNTKLIVQSIPPVDASFDVDTSKGLNNDKINKLNYYIAEMCSSLNLPFLNSAETMKDENGVCKSGYCRSDGIHPSKAGNQALIDYTKTHAIDS